MKEDNLQPEEDIITPMIMDSIISHACTVNPLYRSMSRRDMLRIQLSGIITNTQDLEKILNHMCSDPEDYLP